jgi:hypothetical protein
VEGEMPEEISGEELLQSMEEAPGAVPAESQPEPQEAAKETGAQEPPQTEEGLEGWNSSFDEFAKVAPEEMRQKILNRKEQGARWYGDSKKEPEKGELAERADEIEALNPGDYGPYRKACGSDLKFVEDYAKAVARDKKETPEAPEPTDPVEKLQKQLDEQGQWITDQKKEATDRKRQEAEQVKEDQAVQKFEADLAGAIKPLKFDGPKSMTAEKFERAVRAEYLMRACEAEGAGKKPSTIKVKDIVKEFADERGATFEDTKSWLKEGGKGPTVTKTDGTSTPGEEVDDKDPHNLVGSMNDAFEEHDRKLRKVV